MGLEYEISKCAYDPEFVAKIVQRDEDIKAGRTTKIKLDDYNCGENVSTTRTIKSNL